MLFLTLLVALGTVSFETMRLAHAVVLHAGGPEEILRGIAPAPFQYRVLVSFIVRCWTILADRTAGDHSTMFVSIDYLACALGLFANVALLRSFRASPAWLVALYVMLLANYVFASPRIYFDSYDVPAIMFCALGIWLIHQARWVGYFAMLPVAILNRETAASLVLLFALVEYGKLPNFRYWVSLAAQIAICALVILIVREMYPRQSQPFDMLWGSFEDTGRYLIITANLKFIASARFLPVFGFMWLPFIVAWWRLDDPFLRRAAWLVPIFMIGMLFVGNFFEFRIFSELLPVMMIVIAGGLSDLFSHALERIIGAAAPPSG